MIQRNEIRERCPECKSSNLEHRKTKQMYRCNFCRHVFKTPFVGTRLEAAKPQTKGSGQIAGRTFKRMIVHGESR